MEIVNHKTKHKSVVNFKPCGWFGKDLHVIDGGVYDKEYEHFFHSEIAFTFKNSVSYGYTTLRTYI